MGICLSASVCLSGSVCLCLSVCGCLSAGILPSTLVPSWSPPLNCVTKLPLKLPPPHARLEKMKLLRSPLLTPSVCRPHARAQVHTQGANQNARPRRTLAHARAHTHLLDCCQRVVEGAAPPRADGPRVEVQAVHAAGHACPPHRETGRDGQRVRSAETGGSVRGFALESEAAHERKTFD